MTDPAPLVPADVDLRDFQFMPLDVRRLLTSETWLTGTGDERAAAMTLWLESWHQVPAGSLPNNDRMLAHLSQAGAKWKRVRSAVLRSWVLCSDGRYYHPVVAEKALEAWERKNVQRERGRRGNAARWGTSPSKGDVNDGSQDGGTSREGEPESSSGPVSAIAEGVPEGSHKDASRIAQGSHGESLKDRKGQGQGQGQGQGKPPSGGETRARGWPPDETPEPWAAVEVVTAGLDEGAVADLWTDWRTHRLATGTTPHDKHADFRRWCREERKRMAIRGRPATEPQPSNPEADQWRQRLKGWRKSRFWLGQHWGPEPGQPGCRCPPEIIAEVNA